MSVAGISSLAATLPTPSSTPDPKVDRLKAYYEERNADVAQLNKDVQSGNMTAAEQDYANIVALGKQDIHRNNPFFHADRATDFNAIGGALQNGDISGAKQALAALYSTYAPKTTDAASSTADATAAAATVNVAG
jgi:hypothetical protein